MNAEKRIIKASFFAGLTDIGVGLFMFVTGWHSWYFERFHVFGVLGLGMVAYAFWHFVFCEWWK